MTAAQRAFFELFLSTAEGRGKLLESMFAPVQNDLDYAQAHPERLTRVEEWIVLFERIERRLDGSESYDRTRFSCLLSDLRVLRDQGATVAV